MSDTGGPYVQTAVLCEKVLQEKDGVISIIRIIDTLNITASGVGVPEEMPAGQVNLPVVIVLKAGMLKGKYELKIVPVTPSAKRMPPTSVSAYFEGDDRGINVMLNMSLLVKEEGVFWFEVSVQDQLLTRIPLRVVYQRLTHSGAEPSS